MVALRLSRRVALRPAHSVATGTQRAACSRVAKQKQAMEGSDSQWGKEQSQSKSELGQTGSYDSNGELKRSMSVAGSPTGPESPTPAEGEDASGMASPLTHGTQSIEPGQKKLRVNGCVELDREAHERELNEAVLEKRKGNGSDKVEEEAPGQ